jgi:hypothetical protein
MLPNFRFVWMVLGLFVLPTFLMFRARCRLWRVLFVLIAAMTVYSTYLVALSQGLNRDGRGKLRIINESPRVIYLVGSVSSPSEAIGIPGGIGRYPRASSGFEQRIYLDTWWYEEGPHCLKTPTFLFESLSNEAEYGTPQVLPDGSFGPLPSQPSDFRLVGEVPPMCITEDTSLMAWTGTRLEQRSIPWKVPDRVWWAMFWASPFIAALLGVWNRAHRRPTKKRRVEG